jgi:hypothetical protein
MAYSLRGWSEHPLTAFQCVHLIPVSPEYQADRTITSIMESVDTADAVEVEGLDDCSTMKGLELSGRSDTLLIDDPCRTTPDKDLEVKDVCASVSVSGIGLFADDSCARRPSTT